METDPTRTRRPNRNDVAALAEVSPSTVTLVLGDRGTELRIAPATQARVRAAAQKLGYYPNKLIRGVLEGRTGVLGLYLRHEQWCMPYGYWPQMVWALQTAISKTDYQLLIHNAREDASTEHNFAQQAGGLSDGVLILNSGSDAIVDRLIEARMPAVELGDSFSRLPFVGMEGGQGVRLAMEHLAERGYRRPVYLGHHTNFPQIAEARASAFREERQRLFGHATNEAAIRMLKRPDSPLAAILSVQPTPDCVLCMSDNLAYLVLAEAQRSGIRVPVDLAIVGFDALPGLANFRVVTSVAGPHEEMAEAAIEKLRKILRTEKYDRATIFQPQLRIGDTT